MSCAESFIAESHPNGQSMWDSCRDTMDFVLSHPNGWDGLQQGRMREASTKAGIVGHTALDNKRIQFVTEGEASLHFCVDGGFTSGAIKASPVVSAVLV